MNNVSELDSLTWNDLSLAYSEWAPKHKAALEGIIDRDVFVDQSLTARKVRLRNKDGSYSSIRFIMEPKELESLAIYQKWSEWGGFTGPRIESIQETRFPLFGTNMRSSVPVLAVQSEYLPASKLFLDTYTSDQREKWTRQLYQQVNYLHGLGAYYDDGFFSNVLIDKSGNAQIIDYGSLAYFDSSNRLSEIAQNYRGIDQLFDDY